MKDDFKKHKGQFLVLLRKNKAQRAYLIKFDKDSRWKSLSNFLQKKSPHSWLIEAFGWSATLNCDVLDEKYCKFDYWREINEQWNKILDNHE